jgi:hypothetical protein
MASSNIVRIRSTNGGNRDTAFPSLFAAATAAIRASQAFAHCGSRDSQTAARSGDWTERRPLTSGSVDRDHRD